MSVFTDTDRVSLWCNDPQRAAARATKIAQLWDGMFSDLFLPRTATRAQFDAVRNTVRPNGTKLKAQLWETPGPLSAQGFAQRVSDDITRLAPGGVDLDIEVGDTELQSYLRDTVTALRETVGVSATQHGRPTYLLRLNIAPYKGKFLPTDLLKTDANLYAVEQTYYGDMSRVEGEEALLDLLGTSGDVPLSKVSLCIGAQDEHRDRLAIGTLLYQGHLVRKLRGPVLVFSDDLLAELQLI